MVSSQRLHRGLLPLLWSLRFGFPTELGPADQDSKRGAAAAGRAVVRVDVVSRAGGASRSGPTGPDPGGGMSWKRARKGSKL